MHALIEFLTTMPFWYWWVFAAILLVIELSTGSTYFLWPAIAAVVVGLFSLSPVGAFWQMQLLLFAAVTVGLSFFAPPYVKPWLHRTQADHLTLNERGAQKVGKRATVDQAFADGAGKVRLGDTLWLAEAEGGENFEAGASVIVVRVEGVKIIVAAA
jgi:membrane protein implicated in regulation of membrane protease activity